MKTFQQIQIPPFLERFPQTDDSAMKISSLSGSVVQQGQVAHCHLGLLPHLAAAAVQGMPEMMTDAAVEIDCRALVRLLAAVAGKTPVHIGSSPAVDLMTNSASAVVVAAAVVVAVAAVCAAFAFVSSVPNAIWRKLIRYQLHYPVVPLLVLRPYCWR